MMKKCEIRVKYQSSGKLKEDLKVLSALVHSNGRSLFQRYGFLQYRIKRIQALVEVSEDFGQILDTLKAKIPTIIKDVENVKKQKKVKEYSHVKLELQQYENESEVP